MPTWKGTVSFGLVEVPVSLVPAERRDEISFTQLDRRDLSPVGNRRYNKATGKEVAWDDLVRGYEYEKGRYAVLTDRDLERADPKATKTIEILEFVDSEEIDPVLFETPYYVVPQKANSRGYGLLREALRTTGKAGIARVVLHTKEHLAALMARGPLLVLDLLRFQDEIRDPKEIEAPEQDPKALHLKAAEILMAEKLIEGMAEDWKPGKHRDVYREEVLALVKKKVREGKTTETEDAVEGGKPERKKPAEVLDLMPLLEKSLAGAGKRKPAARSAGPERAKKRKAG